MIGLVLFSVAYALQIATWLSTQSYPDITLWSHAAAEISRGVFPSLNSATPAHPGTALLLPAALFMRLTAPTDLMYHIALSGLMALVITACIYACSVLRPKSLWWLGAFVLLTVNPYYLDATAPSAYATVLSVLFVLLVLYAREHEESDLALFLLGACSGTFVATRIDIGAAFSVLAFAYLLHILGKRALIMLPPAILFFAVFDPYIYINAPAHVYQFLAQVNANRNASGQFGNTRFVLFLPLVSFLFAFVYVFARPGLTSIRRDFLLWLIAVSEILCGLITLSHYHPLRYYLPFMSIWEIFLVLFALEYVPQQPLFKKLPSRGEHAVIGFFLIARIVRVALYYAGTLGYFSARIFLLNHFGIALD